jgi:hypothetical protein
MTAFTANRTFTADTNRTFGIEIEFKSARPAFEIAQALTDAPRLHGAIQPLFSGVWWRRSDRAH